jgi:four helix bundle protein
MNYQASAVWKKALTLAVTTCRQSRRLPPEERFGMRSQMTRAAISVPSNVAEGWARESRKEKAHFLAIALGSLAELNTQIEICDQLGWLDHTEARPMLALADEVGRMLTVMRRGLRESAG